MPAERWLRIDYLDGTSETFTFPRQAGDDYDLSKRFREAIGSDRVVLEIDGIVRMIPLSAVKQLNFAPAPANLPEQVIRDARLS